MFLSKEEILDVASKIIAGFEPFDFINDPVWVSATLFHIEGVNDLTRALVEAMEEKNNGSKAF